eukprot:CAMPEP_0204431402 /NCGR_PEP_ID=MMETSP0470-20130426/64823_1 /ASSEMBLY_ACC=CAM_ASM_000385 /TAXON_ID=2969 /ORGANISM="Oxyrrhis marina" /LENGTH=89 /DNA_ID=CAMNT_0051429599 /DNA_START=260 /DNA_END=525 /DNA_ORIENTATION=+
MHSEKGISDNGSDGKVVKNVSEAAPHGYRSEFTLALSVEPVHLCDLSAFVVPPQQGDALGMPELQAAQQRNGLNRKRPSIHIVPEEQIV